MKALDYESLGLRGRILYLAIPAIITQMINMLYAIVDRVFIGKIENIGVYVLSGLGICFPIFILITAFGQLISVGATTTATIFLGKKQKDRAEQVLGNAIVLTIVISIVLLCVLQSFKEPLLLLLGASEKNITYAVLYMKIYLLGLPFALFSQLYMNFFICQGFANKTMLVCIVSTAMNIILDYTFINIIPLGVSGVAIATVIAQLASFFMVLVLVRGKTYIKRGLHIKVENFVLRKTCIKGIFLCGIASFMMAITEVFIQSIYNTRLHIYGSDISIAAMVIIQSLMQIIYAFSNGISQAIQPTISYYYGAGSYDILKKLFKMSIVMQFLIALVGSGILIIFRGQLVRIFTNQEEVINVAMSYIPIYLAGWPIFGIQSGVQAICVGLGKTRYSIFLAVNRKIFLLCPLIIFLAYILGVKGIFMAEAIADGIAGIVAALLLKKIIST